MTDRCMTMNAVDGGRICQVAPIKSVNNLFVTKQTIFLEDATVFGLDHNGLMKVFEDIMNR